MISGAGGPGLARLAAQFTRFGLVGVAVNLALYGLYLLVTQFGLEPVRASMLCFATGVPISFFAHRRLSFVFRDAVSIGRKALFAGAYAAAFVIQVGGLHLAHNVAGLPHRPSQFALMCLVAAFLFAVQRRFVFRA